MERQFSCMSLCCYVCGTKYTITSERECVWCVCVCVCACTWESIQLFMCVGVWVHAYEKASNYSCMHACVRACVRACVCVHVCKRVCMCERGSAEHSRGNPDPKTPTPLTPHSGNFRTPGQPAETSHCRTWPCHSAPHSPGHRSGPRCIPSASAGKTHRAAVHRVRFSLGTSVPTCTSLQGCLLTVVCMYVSVCFLNSFGVSLCVCVCMRMCVHAYACMCVHVCRCVHACVCVCVCVFVCVCVCE